MTQWRASYLDLAASGELARRARALGEMARACRLCPRECGVDRLAGQRGYCGAGARAKVASHNAHHGEEPPISGSRGSGTIFFAHCTMRCAFCQNFPISQLGHGRDARREELAEMMLTLQRRGCHNLNLVTPTHYLHAFAAALEIAVARGFDLPVVYNTSGYERVATLRLLEGIVDIYMPDMKYVSERAAREWSDAPDYVARNLEAVREMHRQVGGLKVDAEGIARRGLLVRHLMLPGIEDDTIRVLERLRDEVSATTWVSLMSQYFPAHHAHRMAPLDRRIDCDAYARAVEWLESTTLQGWSQPLGVQ